MTYKIIQGGGNSLVEAIRNNSTTFAIEQNQCDGGRGGVLVFPSEVTETHLDGIRVKLGGTGWVVGRFFKGVYAAEGKVFSEDSLSVKIPGVNRKELFKIAEAVKAECGQEPLVVKDYSCRQAYLLRGRRRRVPQNFAVRFSGVQDVFGRGRRAGRVPGC